MAGKRFIDEDFLLQTAFAKKLYHDYASQLPIIDYHNHLPPFQIAQNHQFLTITEAWLAGDHYKWRAMRIKGIPEDFITGKKTDRQKFQKWAETVPYTLRNPLFHWTHLELKRYFGIAEFLNGDNADAIYEQTTAQLELPENSTLGLLNQMKVEVVCTTDDPIDSLEHHKARAKTVDSLKMLPSFRPDKAYHLNDLREYLRYLASLEEASGLGIESFADLLTALENRIDYFNSHGCRLADHGLEKMPDLPDASLDIEAVFAKILNKKVPSPAEMNALAFEVLQHLCRCYSKKGWVQQFHLGALRNNNSRRLKELGADTGYDSIGDFPQAVSLSNFLNALEEKNSLAKTIIYNLNPSDNEVMATMAGNFSGGGEMGKIQWGSAWWFLDQKDGMEKQLNTLSNMGLLSCFVGMLTDSRSFLSFPRHEYFRRILCNLLGEDVATGNLPSDEKWLGQMVQDICYNNARDYFPFKNRKQ